MSLCCPIACKPLLCLYGKGFDSHALPHRENRKAAQLPSDRKKPVRTAGKTGQFVVCAVPRHGLSVGANPARQLSLQPVAIGAGAEATKRLKPPM
jgi:hypothetical protein